MIESIDSLDWPQQPQPSRKRRRLLFLILGVVAVVVFFSRTVLSYFVDSLWFDSLGYEQVFLKKLGLQWMIFAVFSVLTFSLLYGWFLLLRRKHRYDLPLDRVILVNGHPLKLPLERFLRLIALVISLLIAAITGGSM